MTSIQRRVARLTTVYGQSRTTAAQQRLLAKLSKLTREERHERMRELVLKLMRARKIEPIGSETLADAAVRALATTGINRPGWQDQTRRLFSERITAPQIQSSSVSR